MNRIDAGSGTHRLTHRFTREAGFARWTLSLITQGSAKSSTSAGSHIIYAPSILLIEPFTPYTVIFGNVGKSWKEWWIIFDDAARWHPWLNWPCASDAHTRFRTLSLKQSEHRQSLTEAMRDAYTYSTQPTLTPMLRESLLANALERVLLLADHINPQKPLAVMDSRVLAAIDILASPDTRQMSMDQLAEQLQISASHLAHLFTQQTGQSVMQFYEQQKHRRAAELLLSTNHSIANVARTVGYENAFHFSTRFRKWAGVSPRQFRAGKTKATPSRSGKN